jgi:hypothetical protein
VQQQEGGEEVIFCPNSLILIYQNQSQKAEIMVLKYRSISVVPPKKYAKIITLATCNHVTKSFGSSICINIIMISSWNRRQKM